MSMYDANDIKTANSIITQRLMSPSHTVNEQYHKELYREYVTNSSVTCLTDLLAENCGWNDFFVTGLNMALNLVSEYFYDRYFVYRKTVDTNKKASDQDKERL